MQGDVASGTISSQFTEEEPTSQLLVNMATDGLKESDGGFQPILYLEFQRKYGIQNTEYTYLFNLHREGTRAH